MKPILYMLILACLSLVTNAQNKRPITPTDIYRLQQCSDPKVSPDGNWVLYSLGSVDTARDKSVSDLWMVSWDGRENIQLTFDKGGETNAQWSPDGKYISFVATRSEDKYSQLYVLDRRGGEAKKLTDIKGDLED